MQYEEKTLIERTLLKKQSIATYNSLDENFPPNTNDNVKINPKIIHLITWDFSAYFTFIKQKINDSKTGGNQINVPKISI